MSDEPQQPDVGEQLKRAREKQGLSLKDVADAQHLRVSIIQSIENADYDQIDSELFLKGYVRTYAKQVGVDADELIRTLDVELEPLRQERAKQEQENPLVDIERRRRKKRQMAKLLILVLILTAAAFAGWKLILEPRMAAEEIADAAGVEEVVDSEPGTLAESGEDQPANLPTTGSESEEPEAVAVEDAASPTQQESVADSGFTSENIDSAESVSAEAVESSEPEPASPNNEPREIASVESEGAEAVAAEPVSIEPVAQPDPVFEESAQPEAVAAPSQLEMSFVADCWVQVTDASGVRLVASLQRAGEQFSVSGRAPLSVVIGAVDAVDSVSFGGEPVELTDYRVVNNRTEFTLAP